MQDCASKGRAYKPQPDTVTGKLSVAQRKEIRAIAAREHVPQADLAARFGVSQTRISQIVNGKPRRYKKYHSAEVVFRIRKLYAEGIKQADLAERFELGQSTISRIVRGESGNSERQSAAEREGLG